MIQDKAEGKNSEKVFNEGDHVYFYLADNGKIEIHEGQLQDKDEIGNRYRIAVSGDERGRNCIYFVPARNVFHTKDKLYYDCEDYCSELSSYWKSKADEFYALWLHGNKEKV